MVCPKRIFEIGQPVHIISHAVEGRKIFANEDDCYRFIFQVYAANIGCPCRNPQRKNIITAAKGLLKGKEAADKFLTNIHSPFVSILDFSMVVNHYHFYLLPNVKNGIQAFMARLNTGYAKYFNLNNQRSGVLFDGRYKGIPVKTEFQSDAVSRYVSIINPLDVYQPKWRESGLRNVDGAFEFLKNYEFSSFPDKSGKRNSKIMAPDNVRKAYSPEIEIQDKEQYLDFVKDFLLKQRDASFSDLFLE